MPRFLSRFGGPLLLFLGGLGLIAVAPLISPDRSETAPPPEPPPEPSEGITIFEGSRQPPAVSAAGAGLTDADDVVGVLVHRTARAYALKALQGRPQNHVINDLVDGTPVTVTYSDMGRCVRAYIGRGSEPLGVDICGFHGGEMILRAEGRLYAQRSGVSIEPKYPGRLPYDAADYQLTTWKKWREAHPNTDVVVEVPPPPRR